MIRSPTRLPWLPAWLIGLSLVAATPALAVDCNPGDITLASQAQVDSFQADHGPCNRVSGTLTISGADITNLDALSGLTNIFWLQISGNPLLDDLLGLSSVTDFLVIDLFGNGSLTSVDGLSGDTTPGSITLFNNPSLADLDAFSGVTSLNGSLSLYGSAVVNLDAFSNLTTVSQVINIIDNSQLQNITGLASVTGFSGTYYVRNNPQLASLDGIGGESDLTGLVIWNNDTLTHIDGFSGLETIGNQYSELVIRDNENLDSIGGLAAVVGVNAGLDLRDNPRLDDCSALRTLLDSVDDADPGPGPGAAGIPDLNGELFLEGNLSGCNTLDEILPPATFHYGGIINNADQLLFSAVNVSEGCFANPILLPDLRRLPSTRLIGACNTIPYANDDLLVYDVARDECRVFDDFATSTPLQLYGIYQGPGNLGAPLRERAEMAIENDRFALLFFDAFNGALIPGESSSCPPFRASEVIFNNGFE